MLAHANALMWTPHGSAMLADGKSTALYGDNATHDNRNDLTELSVLLLGPRRLARDLHALDRQALPHGARYLEVVDVRELFDARLQRVLPQQSGWILLECLLGLLQANGRGLV